MKYRGLSKSAHHALEDERNIAWGSSSPIALQLQLSIRLVCVEAFA